MPAINVENVRTSYRRCAANSKFMDDFYGTFLESSPRVKPYFKNSDLDKLKGMIRHGLILVFQFAAGELVGQIGMKRIAQIHGKGANSVDPTLYAFWRESLIKTVRKHDPKFTSELEKEWRAALQPAIDFMISEYNAPASPA